MRKTRLAVTTVLVAMTASFTALAGAWKSDANGWWYDEGNGSYPKSTWSWIDGNNDGVSECYYFDGDGYCLMNTTTPDNNSVDANGAWVVNGTVQTKETAAAHNSDQNSNQAAAQAVAAYREALLNNTLNTCGVPAKQFAVVDIFNDGVPEVLALAKDNVHDDHGIYFSTIMFYKNGLQTIWPDGGRREIFSSVDTNNGQFCTIHSMRSYVFLYQFDGEKLTEIDNNGSDDFEDKISDENKGIEYVDFTQENLDKYLSGNGTVTGFSVEAIELD